MSDAQAAAITRVLSRSPMETEAVGGALAAAVDAGTVLGLSGPLGAGKTCFARGVAERLGIDPTTVTSPTFVYLVDYPDASTPLHHADLYRLADLPEASAEVAYESIGLLAAFAAGGIAVVEWWDRYQGPMPPSLVRVEFVIENVEHRRIEAHFVTRGGPLIARAFEAELATLGIRLA
jgi:tRNA threonylcarbamoyladenosine biosynthesis protein TsaE